MTRHLPLLALLLGATACDDALLGEPVDDEGLVYTPDWDGVVAMAEDHCLACHAPGGSADFAPLPDVLQQDLQTGTGRLVVPEDPEASALWRMIGGTLAPGDPGDMPLGQRLAESQVDHVRLWILDGAPFPPLVVDGDEDGVSTADGDCDDGNPAVYPGAPETCDGIDNNCDGDVDGADADGARPWYPDNDGDGFGDEDGAVVQCNPPAGYGPTGGDCDDSAADVYPNAPEPDCTDPTDYNCDGLAGAIDADGDGFWACEECDDGDPASFPGAVEVCDGADNDCNGAADDGAVDAVPWYPDADGDGHGDASHPGDLACAAPQVGWLDTADDCNDGNATVSPSADEVCNGVDSDCNGVADDNAIDQTAWYPDADGDGYGDENATPVLACTAPPGTVALGGDCNDTDTAYNPAASETDCADPNDYNCDGVTGQVDGDGDGWFACEECDDTDPNISPDGVEVCDGVDNDCSGAVDDQPNDGQLWFPDADLDGHGDASDPGTLACSAPAPGWRTVADDCDDADALIHPGAVESCDGVDDDCSGVVDDNAIDAITWYADGDGDGDGAGPAVLDCDPALAGHAPTGTDCDDTDPLVSGIADEVCDGLDNDCSGVVDDAAIDADTWYPDADGDGVGTGPGTLDCAQPPGHVLLGGDCDDADSAIHPGADETCDGIDNDCSGLIDDDAVDADTWYADADGDGYGDETDPGQRVCVQPLGEVLDNTDCDDGDPAVNPGAPADPIDGVDNDCDGQLDEDGALLSHALDVQPIWDANCTVGCHSPPFPSGGMDLSNGYAAIVNVPSQDVPTMDRVEPFDPTSSYLWHKLQGTQATVGGAGVQMPANAGGPPGGSSLPAQDLAVIEQWILDGALP